MKRIIMMVLRLGVKSIYYFLKLLYLSKKEEKDLEYNYKVIREITIAANKAGKVKVEAYGVEKLPKEDGFILFPNHQGLYDCLAFIETCPRPLSFVIKKEAKDIILLKQVIKATKSLYIDREDIRQSMEVILTMSKEVRNGRNFVIYPEGTRSKLGNRLLDFKPGSFKSAVKAKSPVVPCAIIDAFIPFDENHTKPVTVKIVYLEPMCYEEYKDMNTTELSLEVKRRIEKAIEKYSK